MIVVRSGRHLRSGIGYSVLFKSTIIVSQLYYYPRSSFGLIVNYYKYWLFRSLIIRHNRAQFYLGILGFVLPVTIQYSSHKKMLELALELLY